MFHKTKKNIKKVYRQSDKKTQKKITKVFSLWKAAIHNASVEQNRTSC